MSGPTPRVSSPHPLVLRTAARILLPLMVAFSIYLVLRGHNRVGGGFIGALVAGAAFALRYFAAGPEGLRRWRRLGFDRLIGAGLLVAVGVGVAGLVGGGALLEGGSVYVQLPVVGELALYSSLLFDVGVYLVVAGVILAAFVHMGER